MFWRVYFSPEPFKLKNSFRLTNPRVIYEYDQEDTELSLKFFDLQILIIDIYDKIVFEETPEVQ